MPRPTNLRRIDAPIPSRIMKPSGVPAAELEQVVLSFDEVEAIRLADYKGLYQEAAARSMGVSRQTFGRIIEVARHKVANALLNGKAIRIEGGEIEVRRREESIMRIAVPTNEGLVHEHFGRAREFMVFRVEGSELIDEERLCSPQAGCRSGMASELGQLGITHLVAGNMGESAARLLEANGIEVIRGASGEARAAALALVQGRLKDSGVNCPEHVSAGRDCPAERQVLAPADHRVIR